MANLMLVYVYCSNTHKLYKMTEDIIYTLNGEKTENEYTGRSTLENDGQIFKLDMPGSDELGSGNKLYKCEKCEANYQTKAGLRQHTSSKHEGICFSCKHCEYQATTKGNLKKHQEIKHEGVRYKLDMPGSDALGSGNKLYKCEKCEANYQTKAGLRQHTSSKHEGICFSRKYCGYKATQEGSLKKHQESIHEGIKYSCDKCNYQATQQSYLNTHKKSVHDGVKYRNHHQLP